MRAKIAGGFLLCFVLAAGVGPAAAQEPQRGRGTPPPLSTDPYNIWPAKQLSTPGRLGNYGHYSASIQRRDVGAAPETHTGFSHFLMFTSGEGNVILGGQIVDGPDGKKVIKGETPTRSSWARCITSRSTRRTRSCPMPAAR